MKYALNTISIRGLAAPVAAVCLLLGTSAAAVAGDYSSNSYGDGWVGFAPSGGRFGVSMPGFPHEDVRTIQTPVGPSLLHSFTYSNDAEAYCVMYNDYPAYGNPEAILNGVRDGEIGGGRLITENNVTIAGYPGKRITGVIGGKVFASEFFVVGRRLYQVMYMSTSPVQSVKDAPQYLDSFRLAR